MPTTCRWHIGGRLCDMLKEVGSLTEHPRTNVNKRRRDSFSKGSINTDVGVHDHSTQSTSVPQQAMLALASRAVSNRPIQIPAETTSGNDWDLSNLLLVQMGYIPANSANCSGRNVFPADTAQSWEGLDAGRYSRVPSAPLDSAAAGTPPFPVEASDVDMLSLWSQASATFNLQEWDAYMAQMSQYSTD
ncbi:hypothetical protein B0H34DRAFT_353027 [Crassisporium funariophilum]|nr:hypothetical protein B0H34DRAFT_353027 [Crassisporium funariophilum]